MPIECDNASKQTEHLHTALQYRKHKTVERDQPAQSRKASTCRSESNNASKQAELARVSQSQHILYSQGCEPKTESRFFRSFFSAFRLPKKTETEKSARFFRSFSFHVPVVKNAYKSVWKPRYGWTHGQLQHTAAAAAAAAA